MAEVKKYKKYILQFPEGTSVEDQTKYLKRLQKSLDSDDKFVVVDPKIKVFEREVEKAVEEAKQEEKKTEEPKKDEPAKTETPKEESKSEPKSEPKEPEVKVEKVEVTIPKEEPKGSPLDKSGSSDKA